jgi:hypothetical protein
MKKSLILLLVIILTACSGIGQSDFSRNQQKWQDANISHYRFNLFVGCFCVFSQDMPLVIEVKDGEIISMEYQTGNPLDDGNREYFSKFATIDRLFSELEVDLAGEADEVTVTYDSTHGFPTEISIDFIKEAADDELYLTVSNFEALP